MTLEQVRREIRARMEARAARDAARKAVLAAGDGHTYRRVSRAYVQRWVEPDIQRMLAALSGAATVDDPAVDDDDHYSFRRAEILQADHFPDLTVQAILRIMIQAEKRASRRRNRLLTDHYAEAMSDRDRWRGYHTKIRAAASKGGRNRSAQMQESADKALVIESFRRLRRAEPDAKVVTDADLYRQIEDQFGKPFNTIKGLVQAWKRRQRGTSDRPA